MDEPLTFLQRVELRRQREAQEQEKQKQQSELQALQAKDTLTFLERVRLRELQTAQAQGNGETVQHEAFLASAAGLQKKEEDANDDKSAFLLSVETEQKNVIDWDDVSKRWVLSFKKPPKAEKNTYDHRRLENPFSVYRYSIGGLLGSKWHAKINGFSFPGTVYAFKKLMDRIEECKKDRWDTLASEYYLSDIEVTPVAKSILELKRIAEERWQKLQKELVSEYNPVDAASDVKPYLPHQKNAIDFFLSHACIIGDEMGTGKTRVALYCINQMFTEGHIKHAVVVCRVTGLDVWVSQAKEYFPNTIVPIKVRGSWDERIKALGLQRYEGKIPMYIMGYETARVHPKELEYLCADGILLLDEIQAIKSPDAKVTEVLLKVPAKERRGLTGTPLQNTPRDGWTLFQHVFKGLLGNSYEQFENHFSEKDGRFGRVPRNLKEYNDRIQPFFIRRLKKDTLELPEKNYIRDYESLPMGDEQAKAYNDMIATYAAEIETMSEEKYQVIANNPAVRLGRILQICDGYLSKGVHETPQWFSDGGKLPVVMDLLAEALEDNPDRKVVIWSRFLPPLEMLNRELSHYNPALLHGQVPQEKRGANATSPITTAIGKFWHDKTCRVFLGEILAGGEAIDLSCADTCIFYDQWWAPGKNRQAEDRLHRLGQRNVVNYYTLVTNAPIERHYFRSEWKVGDVKYNGVLHQKGVWIDTAIEGRGVPPLTRKQLLALLREEV